MQMQGMGGGMGGAGGMPTAPADARPPAERYATELQQLKEMGFTDEATNL
jgi:ubiquilin